MSSSTDTAGAKKAMDAYNQKGSQLTESEFKAALAGKGYTAPTNANNPTAYLYNADGSRAPVTMINGYGYVNGQRVTDAYPGIQWTSTGDQMQSGGAYGYYTNPTKTIPTTTTPLGKDKKDDAQIKGEAKTIEQLMAEFYANTPQMNYGQDLQNLQSQITSYTPASSGDLMARASQMADLQISPLIQAINQRKSTADTTAANERQGIEAAYSNVGTQAQQLLDTASQKALESAIARGGGRSGAVEHLTEQMSTPILNQVAQSEDDKAAKLTAIENALSTYKTNASDELTSLEERRGALIDSYYNTLMAQEQALQQGNQTLATNLAAQLAQLERQAQADMNSMMLGLLPYYTNTAQEQASNNLDWTQLIGEVPGTTTGSSNANQLVGLSDAGASMGLDIGYKATDGQTVGGNTYYGNVLINGQEYTPQQLLSIGAVFDWNTQRWKIPQSALQKLG